MKPIYLFILFSVSFLFARAQPDGFVDQLVSSNWSQAVGLQIENDSTLYVWERSGKVWLVKNGQKRTAPLLDLSEEVGSWRDYGLLGFVIDPNFRTNGFVYALYVVDQYHLLNAGSPGYDPGTSTQFRASIGRLTRYTATAASQFQQVDPQSRKVLIGESISTGFPHLHQSHGVGSLVFGEDGSLLVSCGDGASYGYLDVGGGLHGSFAPEGLQLGIIDSIQDVGAFRAQQLNSLNGKVLRIDPATGNGMPGNPFFDPAAPRSARSRVWALGFRNPFRMSLRPGTGQHNPNLGQPGTLYVGDVGWGTWEEIDVVRQGGQNFGWPLYEGGEAHALYQGTQLENPAIATGLCNQPHYRFNQLLIPHAVPSVWPDPCNPGTQIDPNQYDLFQHQLPAIDWRHGNPLRARVAVNDTMYELGQAQSPIPGPAFKGNCAIGGSWYTGTSFPEPYRNSYFFADFNEKWIRNASFDEQDQVMEVRDFSVNNGLVVALATHPEADGLYYLRYSDGNSQLRCIQYLGTANQAPVAQIEADTFFTPGTSLSVQFRGDGSLDPEGAALQYAWDFGDGTQDTLANPIHVFSQNDSLARSYLVRLVVSDTGGATDEAEFRVSLRNTPPKIESVSIDSLFFYPLDSSLVVPLSAQLADDEQALSSLQITWQTVLHHNEHSHPEAPDHQPQTQTILSPVGCDGADYWYRIHLTVSDSLGLESHFAHNILPNCGQPLVRDDEADYPLFGQVIIPVLDNDLIRDSLLQGSFEIIEGPLYGRATFLSETGTVRYENEIDEDQDFFRYRFQDQEGDWAEAGTVWLNKVGSPEIVVDWPGQLDTLYGSSQRIRYRLLGYHPPHAELVWELDEQAPILDVQQFGFLELDSLSDGPHHLRAYWRDSSGQALLYPSIEAEVDFWMLCEAPKGNILREFWTRLSGDRITDFTNKPAYPDHPVGWDYLDRFQGPTHFGEHYGTRVRGYLHPPVSGYYTFFLTGDNQTQLFLSVTEDPEGARKIAEVYQSTDPNQLDQSPSQSSPPIYLFNSQTYYVELLHKEWFGEDHFAAWWQGPLEQEPVIIPGEVLSPWVICRGEPYISAIFDTLIASPLPNWIGLEWSTQQELNIQNFWLERAVSDGPFQAVEPGFWPAQNKLDGAEYSLADYDFGRGLNRYRIAAIGINGDTIRGPATQVFWNTEPMLAFPNPLSRSAVPDLRVSFRAGRWSWFEAHLTDPLGRPVMQLETELNPDQEQVEIPTEDLEPGWYILRVQTDELIWQKKVFVTP